MEIIIKILEDRFKVLRDKLDKMKKEENIYDIYTGARLLEVNSLLHQIKKLNIHNVVSSTVECRHNSRREKYNYLKWVEFAESEIAKGNKQTQCSKCKKWYFPSEL